MSTCEQTSHAFVGPTWGNSFLKAYTYILLENILQPDFEKAILFAFWVNIPQQLIKKFFLLSDRRPSVLITRKVVSKLCSKKTRKVVSQLKMEEHEAHDVALWLKHNFMCFLHLSGVGLCLVKHCLYAEDFGPFEISVGTSNYCSSCCFAFLAFQFLKYQEKSAVCCGHYPLQNG